MKQGSTCGMLPVHIVSKEGIAMDPDKVMAILEAPALKNDMMILYLAEFATPLHGAVHQEPFTWREEEEKAFVALKILLPQAPTVQPLEWNKSFDFFVDASEIAIVSVLMQLCKDYWHRPIYYVSRNLSKEERNHSTMEREELGMIYMYYLLGNTFTFHVDYSTLLCLVSRPTLTGKLARCILFLEEFQFNIVHRPRAQYAVIEYLSQLDSGEALYRSQG